MNQQPNPAEQNTHLYDADTAASVRVPEAGYELIYSDEGGGVIWRHELVDVEGSDYADVLEIATDKANIGCVVHMLPTLPENHPLRAVVFANAKERKCPDLKVNGRYTEVKFPIGDFKPQKISRNIKVAHTQADDVIIKLNSSVHIRALKEIAKGRFATHDHLMSIEFKMEGEYHSFTRTNF